MTVGGFIPLPKRGIPMSQNRVPSAVSSKPHIYHNRTRNMGFLSDSLGLRATIGIFLYPHITQLCMMPKNHVPALYRGNLIRR